VLISGSRLGPYEIVAAIGAGGMGEVYRARDTRLGRDVAVKVLPAQFASDPGRLRRFEQEARAVAALSHPNILAIHDVGTHEGSPFIVSELLEGETLRDRLKSGGLTIRKAVETSVQIAQGLAAAHEKGIVHRDLKPANVFVTKDGHVKILDFGIAKLTRPDPGPQATTLTPEPSTETGGVLGTVGYMSPEQVRGLPTDHRTDIFSFGCVLYEMLSGRSPFRKETTAETMTAILHEDPPALAGVGREIPPALEGIVTRCLEKRPEDRFTSAHDVALALRAFSGSGELAARLQRAPSPWKWLRRHRRVAVGTAFAVLLAVAGISLWLWKGHGFEHRSGLEPKRIVVLPFENLGAAEDAYFADGMTDEVRSKLESLSGLAVIARVSSDQYKGTTKPPKQIAEELSAPFLLTAKIRWQKGGPGASRVRVTPELVEVTGAAAPITRWEDSFEGETQDVFRVQTEIATRVAAVLDVMLASQERQRLEQAPTANLAAYEAYLRGQEMSGAFLVGDLPRLRRAITEYERAVALDPSFALAWAQLSRARTVVFAHSPPSPALAEGARQAAERALRLAPWLPETRLAMGYYLQWVDRGFTRAQEEYNAGLALSPRHAGLLAVSGVIELTLGHWDDGLARLEQATSLDPRSVFAAWLLGRTLLRLGRYPDALGVLDRALVLDPANTLVIAEKAYVFLAKGDLASARSVVSEALRNVEPTTLVVALAKSDLHWILDDSQQRLLLSLTAAAFDGNRAAWGLALAETCALRGDLAQARRFAEEARSAYASKLAQAPENPGFRLGYGRALAYLGRREEAIREAERLVAEHPISRDAYQGPLFQRDISGIYIALGEHEKALDLVEPLLTIPSMVTPGWLLIDPAFAPLRGNPRFEKLLKPRGEGR
jgi:serine/threonine protein kinase/tetratricopeptide (TPR) repeat protein